MNMKWVTQAPRIPTCFFALIALVSTPHAQTMKQEPEQVAMAYRAAFQAADWNQCAALLHSESLRKFRQRVTFLLPVFEWQLKKLQEEVERKNIFGIPADTEKFTIIQTRIFRDLRVSTRAEYERLSDQEVFRRLIPGLAEESFSFLPLLGCISHSLAGSFHQSPEIVHVITLMQTSAPKRKSDKADIKIIEKGGSKFVSLETSGKGEFSMMGMIRTQRLPDDGSAAVLSVKRDGNEWRVGSGEEFEELITDIEWRVLDAQKEYERYAREVTNAAVSPPPPPPPLPQKNRQKIKRR